VLNLIPNELNSFPVASLAVIGGFDIVQCWSLRPTSCVGLA
jgi:hypothetical protein